MTSFCLYIPQVLHSLKHFRGDINVKRFIYDLVMPSDDSVDKDQSKNMEGLSAPTPRGRKVGSLFPTCIHFLFDEIFFAL